MVPDPMIVIDGHVHLHSNFDLDHAVDAAAKALCIGDKRLGMLLLATHSGLGEADLDDLKSLHCWKVVKSEELHSVILHRNDIGKLIVIQGRQIVTDNGLEILVQGPTIDIVDGGSFEETLVAARLAAGLVQIPWGVGKWIGVRGHQIEAAIAREPNPNVVFADSGVRPWFWARPTLLAKAEQAGHICLAGSDPLPIPREEQKIGNYGFVMDGTPDLERPLAWLMDQLGKLKASPPTHGKLESGHRFVQNQLAIRRPAH